MKKSFIYSLAAVFALAACSKEADVQVPTGETVTITAAVDQTRSTEEHASFSWATDEQISVGTSDGEYVAFDVADATKGLFSHTFTGETPDLLVAVSPVQTNAVFIDATAYEVELPAVYNYYDPSKGVTNALMIGTPDPNVSNKFLFRHAAALVKVTYANVPVGTTSFVFEADENLTGTVTLGGLTTNDIEITNGNSELNGSEVWINLPQAVAVPNTTLSFYVPVPTGDYSLLSIYLANAGGKIASTEKTMDRTGKSALHLNRADVFTFPTITLAAEPIVENFNSTTVDNDKYGCTSGFDVSANKTGFDYSWTLSGNGYIFKYGIRLGNGSATGAVTSSDILSTVSAGSNFTVKIYAARWGTDVGDLKVTYDGNDLVGAPTVSIPNPNDRVYSSSDFGAPTEFVFAKTDASTLTVASTSKRIIIDKIEVVPGGTPAPVPTMVVTPDASNPETVPSEGGVLNYTVTTTNIDSWEVSSDNETEFVPEKTDNGFKVTVASNLATTPRSANITVTGGSKSTTITINQAAHAPQDVNTIDDPYSALDAISAMNLLADNTPTVDFYYVEGIVDAVPSWYGASSGELTFTFADENNNQIKAFNCLGINGAHFSGKSDLSIGDHVVVYGNLEKYVKDNQTTYEIVNCNLAALTKAPSIIATLSDAPQISYKGGTMTLEIVANVAWTASINNNATLSIGSGTPAASVSGTTNTTVTVSIPENADGQTYTISFTSTSTEVTVPADIQIVQSAAPTLTGIAVEDYTETYPVSTTETYAFDGKVFALFSDNTREEISSGYSITGTVDLTNADEYELTISYQGFDQTITISVITPGSHNYSIVFANKASSATAISSTTQATTTIGEGRDYVTSKPYTVNSGNCYYGDTKTCIRIGKSGAASQLTIALSDAGKKKATSIVVNCMNMGGKNTGAVISVNGLAGQTTSDSAAADYTFSFSSPTDITSIVLSGDKAIYIYSITVNY